MISDTCFKLGFGLLQDTSGSGQNRGQEPRVPTGFMLGPGESGPSQWLRARILPSAKDEKQRSRNAFAEGTSCHSVLISRL